VEDVLSAALTYAAAGWYVFPVRGKLPALDLAPHWSRDSTTDPQQIAAWYAGAAGLGIGLDLGRSRLIVVDGDNLDRLPFRNRLRGWPFRGNRTRQSWLYRENGHRIPQARHPWGEVKAAGGYVVMPPSPHDSGVEYEWLDIDGDVPTIPPDIEKLIAPHEEASSGQAWDGTGPTDAQVEAATSKLAHQARRVVGAAAGARNQTLNEAALIAGHYVPHYLTAKTVVEALMYAAERCGLIRDDGEKQCAATIRSGLKAGMAQPLQLDPEDAPGGPEEAPAGGRRVRLTSAASIAPQRATWLWHERIAIGTLAILAGREGVGKSTLAYWIVAQVTRGTLPGEHFGHPAAVLVAATEDSWAHTIIPRLIAAGANLEMVYRVDVTTDTADLEISLPHDIGAVGEAARQTGATLLLLDPLMSRLSSALDTHKDADTRQALEPLTRMLFENGLTGLGLMHFNKSGSDDPMNALMASRAFSAVARSVSAVIRDPDDDTRARRLFGTPKNNLGPDTLPLLSFTLEPHPVPTATGDTWTTRIAWGPEVDVALGDVMARTNDSGDRSAVAEAVDWLRDHLTQDGGQVDSATAKRAGYAAGHSERTLARARQKLGVTAESHGFPRRTVWQLPDA
jgi:hypothetical protein